MNNKIRLKIILLVTIAFFAGTAFGYKTAIQDAKEKIITELAK